MSADESHHATTEPCPQRWQDLGPIEIRMVEKHEKCHHNIGDTFCYADPYHPPAEVKCHALLHVLELYIWRVAMGFPSWEDDDDRVYRIHCPAKNGTVWEVRKAEKGMASGL
jgi:uncharacterized repeat protein (TIGR04076 family)